MPKVFIPEVTFARDRVSNTMKPVFDFSDAERFGQLKIVIDHRDFIRHIENNAYLVDAIEAGLSGFEDGDYLLSVGDPVVMMICSAFLFRKFNTVNILRWDRTKREYANNGVTI